MSGVYIAEFSSCINKQISLVISCCNGKSEENTGGKFKEIFSGVSGSILHRFYLCEKSTAQSLKNFIINKFILDFKVSPHKGRERFVFEDDEKLLKFLGNVDQYVLDYFKTNKRESGQPGNIGAILKAKRKKLKLTQPQMSSMTGLRQATISDLENGKIKSIKTLRKACESLSVVMIFANDDGSVFS